MFLHSATPQALDLRVLLSSGSFRDVLAQIHWWHCSYGSRLTFERSLGTSLAVCDSMLPMSAVDDVHVEGVLAVRNLAVDSEVTQQVLHRFVASLALSGSTSTLEFTRDLSTFGASTITSLVSSPEDFVAPCALQPQKYVAEMFFKCFPPQQHNTSTTTTTTTTRQQ